MEIKNVSITKRKKAIVVLCAEKTHLNRVSFLGEFMFLVRLLFEIVITVTLALIAVIIALVEVLAITAVAICEIIVRVLPIVLAGVILATLYHYLINPLW